MKSKLYLGIATLIILLFGTAFVGIIMCESAEIAQLRQEKADFEKVIAEQKKQKTQEVVESNQPPPDEAGFKWVRHGDHWDKIPVANDGEGNTLNPSIWYPPEILALSDDERRELYLQRELERQARHAAEKAEKAENAKIAEKIKANNELLKKTHDITDQIAAINRKMAAINREHDELREKLRAGMRSTPEEYKRLFQLSERNVQLSKQSGQLVKEYDQLVEEYNTKYNNGN